MFLLDTNAWISYLNRPDSHVKAMLERKAPADVCFCSVVKAELNYGTEKSRNRPPNFALLARIYSQFASLPFDDSAAHEYGRIRAELERLGTPIGPNDLMIAAIASANSATLVTHNVAEFSRVPGLLIEDWEVE